VTIFPSRILLATDDSEEAELATQRAVDLADTTCSELHVVYVGRLPNFLMNDPDIMGFYRKLYDDVQRESLEILWRLTWEVKTAGGPWPAPTSGWAMWPRRSWSRPRTWKRTLWSWAVGTTVG
jgi:hypothetical protein